MAQRNDDVMFKQHSKVVASRDLPGIAAGTEGKVLLINGLSWVRYRVLFEGHVERGMLSAADLTTPGLWAAEQREVAETARQVERDARRAAAGGTSVDPSDVPEGSAA